MAARLTCVSDSLQDRSRRVSSRYGHRRFSCAGYRRLGREYAVGSVDCCYWRRFGGSARGPGEGGRVGFPNRAHLSTENGMIDSFDRTPCNRRSAIRCPAGTIRIGVVRFLSKCRGEHVVESVRVIGWRPARLIDRARDCHVGRRTMHDAHAPKTLMTPATFGGYFSLE